MLMMMEWPSQKSFCLCFVSNTKPATRPKKKMTANNDIKSAQVTDRFSVQESVSTIGVGIALTRQGNKFERSMCECDRRR